MEAVVNVLNYMCDILDQCFYDVAFDTVDHETLIAKLLNFGILVKKLLLFKSYLTYRKQYVQVLYSKSRTTPANSDVRQGRYLTKLLFSIYI